MDQPLVTPVPHGDADVLLALTDALCRIPSWWRPNNRVGGVPVHNEMAVAERLAQELRSLPWLQVHIEEVAPGRPNVLAFDGDPAETELLVVGHIDTVPPSGAWTVPEFSVRDGRYFALGAADAKAAIAAALDAARRVGPTKGVGYLFYCDEEYEFIGMKHFVAHHPSIRPAATFSLCGGSGQIMAGCRGLLEVGVSLQGHGGHASRPRSGRSATRALHVVLDDLAKWVNKQNQPYKTVLNVAALHAGSMTAESRFGDGPPQTEAIPNRIPDGAWALLELRTGSPAITAQGLREVLESSLARHNQGEALAVRLARFDVHLDMHGFASEAEALRPLTQPFDHLHCGVVADPAETGYIDVALISGRDGSPALCLGPLKGRAHAPDEWVDLSSLAAYRNGLVDLIGARSVTRPLVDGCA